MIIAGLYYGAARLGLLFAIPPGFATPLWPPSGISAVYLFIYGIELWPGVFIGSLLSNLHEFQSLKVLLLPFSIATGSTIYLYWVVKLLHQKFDLKNFFMLSRKTLVATLWVGPIAALLSSVWGSGVLLLFDKITWAEAPFTWLNWWMGDMAGILVFFPLCLLGTHEYKAFRGQLIKLVIIPLMISILLCLGVFLFSQRSVSENGTMMSWFILVFSLAVTGLLEILLLSIVLRNIQIETLVQEKTLHLQLTNQQLQKALRAKSEFLANVSHEVRTPLNSILGKAQVLSETSLDEDQKKYLEIFNRSGSALLALINDILDWSKLESHKIEIVSEPFVLRELLNEVIELFDPQAEVKGIRLNLSVAPEIVGNYLGDPARTKQILINLVGNAIKFTDKGQIDIHVLKNTTILPGTLLFEIQDTGIGITEGQANNLFTIFTQADSSITKRYGGTGLGLAISKKLVELMNGRIAVKSEFGKGSLFYFTIDCPMFHGTIENSTPAQ